LRDEGYASKARPVVIVQADSEELFNSLILSLFTTFESSHIPTRVLIAPDEAKGVKKDSYIMIEKLITELVPKSVILSPALAVSQAKALRNRIFQGCSSKI
jgi:mRNA-degrading endonuclease toxin of MazEF toxin-antitoxin module